MANVAISAVVTTQRPSSGVYQRCVWHNAAVPQLHSYIGCHHTHSPGPGCSTPRPPVLWDKKPPVGAADSTAKGGPGPCADKPAPSQRPLRGRHSASLLELDSPNETATPARLPAPQPTATSARDSPQPPPKQLPAEPVFSLGAEAGAVSRLGAVDGAVDSRGAATIRLANRRPHRPGTVACTCRSPGQPNQMPAECWPISANPLPHRSPCVYIYLSAIC